MSAAIRARQIGPWGTAARALVGVAFIAWAAWLRPGPSDVVIGLVGIPVLVVGLLALRGADAPPLRMDGPIAHASNIAVFFVLFNIRPPMALLFYGASMVLAAWRGIGACEMFAISNVLRRRDDQLGCPLFLPVDAAESRVASRMDR